MSTNGKFKSAFVANYLSDNNNLPQTDLTDAATKMSPNAPPLYNVDGSLNWADRTWPGGVNPLYNINRTHRVQAENLISNINLSYKLLKGLEIKTNFGFTNLQINELDKKTIAAQNPNNARNVGESYFVDNNIHSWIIEPQLTYQLLNNRNKLEALIGSTFQQSKSEGSIIRATGYTSDALLENIQAAPIKTFTSTTSNLYKYNAIFGRLNYNLKEKYITSLTARRDGSSRFGNNNKFHNFGSVGTSWIFSEEHFMRKVIPALSFGKLRGSYGTTGNDQIPDYQFYNLFNTSAYTYQEELAITPSNLYNPDLQWETTIKTEIGLDLGFFKDKILLNTSYYRNRSSNQLLQYTLPSTTGFTSLQSNLPATVQNDGWEFMVNTINMKGKHFSWNSSANISFSTQ